MVVSVAVTFSAVTVFPMVLLNVPSELITLYSAGVCSETVMALTSSTNGFWQIVPFVMAF